jgi:hypothetical protein
MEQVAIELANGLVRKIEMFAIFGATIYREINYIPA